jgi:hypothetical protein
VVVPVPARDRDGGRRRPARGRARSDRLRSLRQTDRSRRLQLRRAPGVADRVPRRPRAARGHALVPGLGRTPRAAPGRRPPRALRPGGRGQHVLADGRRPASGRVLRVATVRPDRAGVPDRSDRRPRHRARSGPRGHRRLRRALPRSVAPGRRPTVPGPGPGLARRSGGRRQPRRLGRPRGLPAPVSDRLRRQRSHHPRRRSRAAGAHRWRRRPAPTRPWPAPATSSRRTTALAWARSSSTCASARPNAAAGLP